MISDFFQVEILFEMLFQIYLVDQIKLAPDLLICLLDYDKDHPKTKLFLQCLSESISLTSEQIFSMISSKSTSEMLSTNKLKNKIRDILRHSKYVNKCLRTLCSFCNKMGLYMKVDTMTFRFMSLTPYCGSLIHNTCIADFNSSYDVKSVLHSCIKAGLILKWIHLNSLLKGMPKEGIITYRITMIFRYYHITSSLIFKHYIANVL